ncbi:MAG: polysaccharide pyruvyl transferase family protein [Solirubrobacteraceae bacterium]
MTASADLRVTLQRRYDAVIADVLAQRAPVALIGFPNHSNPGDSAIWVGQLAALRRGGHRIAYVCDWLSYDEQHLRRRAPDATILMHGGGNLGDIWPEHQRLRERIVAAFPDRRIVQLPQTLYFSDPRNLERARRVFDAHPDLTLLLRDQRSLVQSQDAFASRSLVCPDSAFALGPLPRLGEPDTDVVWLARTDAEAASDQAGGPPDAADVRVIDWLSEAPGDPGWNGAEARRRLATRGGGRVVAGLPALVDPLAPALWQLYDRHAELRVQYGRRLLSGGRGLVTNRLHGHILALLMDIPHVVLDNSYGKNRTFYDTWTWEWPRARWSSSPASALDELRALPDQEAARRAR